MLRTVVCLPYHQHPLLPNGRRPQYAGNLYSASLSFGVRTEPIEQFNVLLRTRATGALQTEIRCLHTLSRRIGTINGRVLQTPRCPGWLVFQKTFKGTQGQAHETCYCRLPFLQAFCLSFSQRKVLLTELAAHLPYSSPQPYRHWLHELALPRPI